MYARKFVSKVRLSPSLEGAQLGYLRAGTILKAKTAEPVGHDRCLRAWYEISETGGFVCDGRELIAFAGARAPDRVPTPADRAAPLPYLYAYNRRALLFDWTSPTVPRAFHAAYPSGALGKGTVLVIRGTTPRG